MGNIEGVQLTALNIIEGPSGNVLHALKGHEDSFNGFGEAYFSTIHHNSVKGWKRHRQMTLNIVVPIGSIKFVLFDGRETGKTYMQVMEIELSQANYKRLTVPPGIWMAFKGTGEGLNLLLNIASIPHDPLEADNLPFQNDIIPFTVFPQ